MQRAAQAVSLLCDRHRGPISKRAERADKVRETGFMASSSVKASFSAGYKAASFSGATVAGSISASAGNGDEDEVDELLYYSFSAFSPFTNGFIL